MLDAGELNSLLAQNVYCGFVVVNGLGDRLVRQGLLQGRGEFRIIECDGQRLAFGSADGHATSCGPLRRSSGGAAPSES